MERVMHLYCHCKVSNVEESSLRHLAISPVQTSRAGIPTTLTAPGLLLWPRAPPSSWPFTTLSWSTMPTVLTTTSRSTMAYRRMRGTSLGHFVVTSPLHSSPLPGMSCPSSSIQTTMWPTGASVLATGKVTRDISCNMTGISGIYFW